MALSRIQNNSVSSTSTIDQSKITGLAANVSNLTSITDTQAFNIGLLGFKLAVQNGLTVYNLKDGIVDEFASSAGVGTSPGAQYNPSSSPGANNYSNQVSASYNANYTTTALTGPGAPFGVAASQASAPTSFGSFTAPPTINGGVTAYVFGAGGMGGGIGSAPTLYNFGLGGGGGFASGAFPVSGGSTVYLAVGGGGPATGTGGSYNGGGNPGAPGGSVGGGGGLVGIFSTTYGSISAPSTIIIAGSGGGGSSSVYAGGLGQYGGADGGGGGGTQGLRGGDQSATTSNGPQTYVGTSNPGTISGGGGSQSQGGSAGTGVSGPGVAGSLFTGATGGAGGGAGYYGGGGAGSNPGGGGGAGRGNAGGGGGSSYYGNPIVTSGTTTSAVTGPAGGAYNSGGASSPYWVSGVGRGGQGPGTPAPGSVAGGDGYVVLTWSTVATGTATITSSTFATLNSLVPTKARLVVFQDNISPDTATINTDLVASVSRDNGTTFTTVTLTNSGYITGASGQKILTGTADISSQPSGGNMKWKIVAQTKGQKIYGVSLQWV